MPRQDSEIVRTPKICAGCARIKGTEIPVWRLACLWRGLEGDQKILEAYPQLTIEDLDVAWRHYVENRREIEREVRENDQRS